MLNTTEHVISTAHKNYNTEKLILFLLDVFIMLIYVKMPTIVGILTFMSMIKFMLSQVEHEFYLITSGQLRLKPV